MNFLYPGFLWALLALLIPIIIHLFYFRRFKKVYFSNVKFLKELKEETSNRNKLKNLLILLSRLLALAFLVFAFAQPFLRSQDSAKEGNNSVSIFIDNSFSMNALSEEVPLIELAKRKATEIINAYAENDKFQIITHDFKAKYQRSLSKEDAISAINEVEISPEVKMMDQILLRQNQVHYASDADNLKSYIISDFQKSIINTNSIPDSSILTFFLTTQSIQENNVSLDSAWFLTPVPLLNQSNQLVLKITNHSNAPAENLRMSINQDGQTKPFGLLDIESKRSVFDTINIRLQNPGIQKIGISVTDYPIQFDDNYLMSFKVPERIKILEIHNGRSNKYLQALFNGLIYFELSNQASNNISYAEFSEYDMLILNDLNQISSGLSTELSNYLKAGGNVLLFPGKQADIDNLNSCLTKLGADIILNSEEVEKEVKEINTREFVFDDVFTRIDKNVSLPKSKMNFNLSRRSSAAAISLMKYRDGSDYLRKYNIEKGSLFLSSSPLELASNDLVQKAEVFVPLIYKASLYTGLGIKPSYTIGKDELIEVQNLISNEDMVYKITGEDEFIPGQTNKGRSTVISLNNMIKKEGIYKLSSNDQLVESFAFNYDRTESNLDCYNSKDLQDNFGSVVKVYGEELQANFSDVIKENELAKYFWKWCLLLVLLFLFFEGLLIRFWPNR